jgi:hypothetical protein
MFAPYGGSITRPIKDVASTQNATNARPECQKKRLSPVAFNSFVTPTAPTKPNATVKKKGGK